ncbi:MAG: YggS family pyridoxal phosphate-dependent enzyme [Steroidobacteraceae bacterium]|jgi:PLP dependent protein
MLIGPQNSLTNADLEARIHAVRVRMAAAARLSGRNEDSVTLVAVSKGHEAAAVRAAAGLGLRQFGESYLQEALPKMASLEALQLSWHFIGRLQANKTRAVAEHFDWVHGLERRRIAERLAEQRPFHAPALNVCIQVNIAGDSAKAGIAAADCAALAGELATLPRIKLRGLMCMLPEALDATQQRQAFTALHSLLLDLNRDGAGLDTLSMGMSGDFELAIAAGATLVRVGTAVFGERAAVT